LVTSASLPLVAGEDEVTLGDACSVFEATESDRPLVDDAAEVISLEAEPRAARRSLSSKVDLRVVVVDEGGFSESGFTL
jgi:hypothetical protein